MAKTFTLKVPTSHTPFYAPFTPLKANFGISANFFKMMPQNSVEKSANGILYPIPGRPCVFTEIYMFFFVHVFLAKKIFSVKREMSFGRVNGHGGKSIY